MRNHPNRHRSLRRTLASIAFSILSLPLAAACLYGEGEASSEDPEPTTSSKGEKVLVAFKTAGLAVREPRDNTAKQCPTIECEEWITTEDVSIVVFSDKARQKKFTRVFNDSITVEDTVLSFAAQRTPIFIMKKYGRVAQRTLD